MLKLSELIASRLRAKKLVGKTISFWYRNGSDVILGTQSVAQRTPESNSERFWTSQNDKVSFTGDGRQMTIPATSDGLTIFEASWKIFNQIWDKEAIRMVGISVSNLKLALPETISFLDDIKQQTIVNQTLDQINNKYGQFTLQRSILLTSAKIIRKPNSFLSDRRFKI